MSARYVRHLLRGAWLLGLLCFGHHVSAQTVYYVHTDALGSIVAESDSAGQVVSRREYEPYGQQLAPTVGDGPGYTGHVQDAATGLTYMQQRYYDPYLGMFLSVDPVSAYGSGDMRHLNLYVYAYSNPYKFNDPDGRCPRCSLDPGQIARMASAARIQTAQMQAESALKEQVATIAQVVSRDFDDGRGTLQVGVAINGQVGVIAGATQAGLAIDRKGGVAVYSEYGGGIGQGAQAAAGVTAQVTNAESVLDLAGRALNVSTGGGKVAYGSMDLMTANARDESAVYGVGGTVGAGVGGGGSAGISYTYIIPLTQSKKEDR